MQSLFSFCQWRGPVDWSMVLAAKVKCKYFKCCAFKYFKLPLLIGPLSWLSGGRGRVFVCLCVFVHVCVCVYAHKCRFIWIMLMCVAVWLHKHRHRERERARERDSGLSDPPWLAKQQAIDLCHKHTHSGGGGGGGTQLLGQLCPWWMLLSRAAERGHQPRGLPGGHWLHW